MQIKSYSFFSFDLNKTKYDSLLDIANNIRDIKNVLSYNFYHNYIYDLFNNNLSKFNFMKLTNSNRKEFNITSNFYQQIQKELYTCYMNRINKIKDIKLNIFNHRYNMIKHKNVNISNDLNNKFIICIKYLFKSYKFNFDKVDKTIIHNNKTYHYINYINKTDNKQQIINYLIKSNKSYHKYILQFLYNEKTKNNTILCDKIFDFIFYLKNKYINHLIVFKSLTFSGINMLSHNQMMIEKSTKEKHTNAVINLNIPKFEKIIILTRYNKKYHGNLSQYAGKPTKMNQSQTFYTLQFISKNKIKITLIKNVQDNTNLIINCDNDTTLGVDINTKNNLFALSDNNFIYYDKWLIKKYKILEKHIAKKQKNKNKYHLDRHYNNKTQKRIDKFNRIVKAESDKKANELIQYCKENNYTHIVLEDLNIQSKCNSKKNGINYNNIAKLLHINDLKNVIKRIGNRENIIISFVSPRYTSQTCPKCGHISKNNRQSQETFCCENCGHKNNADTNASINIKERITNDILRNILEIYNKKENMYKENNYINKSTYEKTYKKII